LVSFESLEVSTPFLSVFKKIIVFILNFRILYDVPRKFVLSHKAFNELCYVAQFVNSIVTE
jgi:hypothetical protein